MNANPDSRLSGRIFDGSVSVSASMLLFPATAVLYGVFRMFFAAKEAVEKKAMARGRREGIKEGRKGERERILSREYDEE